MMVFTPRHIGFLTSVSTVLKPNHCKAPEMRKMFDFGVRACFQEVPNFCSSVVVV